jgi:hypothetical protein
MLAIYYSGVDGRPHDNCSSHALRATFLPVAGTAPGEAQPALRAGEE